MASKIKKDLINAVELKVKNFFKSNPCRGHDFKHAQATVNWSIEISKSEKPRKPYIGELAAWLHDIGRVAEFAGEGQGKRHHELSYELIKKWFSEDEIFDSLNKDDKIELLYSVRYHWNDEANDYDTAWILRDADKLDLFGKQGLNRVIKYFKGDPKGLSNHFRIMYQINARIHTKTARKIIADNNMWDPIARYEKALLESDVKKIRL